MSASLTIRCDGEWGCWKEIRSNAGLDIPALLNRHGWKLDEYADGRSEYVCPSCQDPAGAELAAMVANTRAVLDMVKEFDGSGFYLVPCSERDDNCLLHVHSYDRDPDEGPYGRISAEGAHGYRAQIANADGTVAVDADGEEWYS